MVLNVIRLILKNAEPNREPVKFTEYFCNASVDGGLGKDVLLAA